jgi:hypothetical protein
MNHELNTKVFYVRSVFAAFTSVILMSQAKHIMGRHYNEILLDRIFLWIIGQYILIVFLLTQLVPIKRIRRFQEISTLSWNFLWAWVPTCYLVYNYEIYKDTHIEEVCGVIFILALIYIPIFVCIRLAR